jgi:di/tricarboxylate transporter
MRRADRVASLTLLVAAAIAWALVAALFVSRSPVGDRAVQLLGAALLGVACAATTLPFAFLATVALRHGRARQGDWVRAARRATLVGLVVGLLVVLRTQGAFTVPLALVAIGLVVVIEVLFTVTH